MLRVGATLVCGALTFVLSSCAAPTQTPIPPSSAPKTTLSIATQRSAAQAALATEFGAEIFTTIFAHGTSQDFGGASTAPFCNNGTTVSIASKASSFPEITTTVDVFYDAACTKISAHIVLQQQPSTLFKLHHVISFLDGTATFTSRAGTVVAYDTFSGDVDKGFAPFSIFFIALGTTAASPSATATGSFRLSCYYSGSSKTCGFATIQNILPMVEVGDAFTFNGTETDNAIDVGGATLNAYVSAPNAMSFVPPSDPSSIAWTIAGGEIPRSTPLERLRF